MPQSISILAIAQSSIYQLHIRMTIIIIMAILDIYNRHHNQSYAYAYANLQFNLHLPTIKIIRMTNVNDHFMIFTNTMLPLKHTNNYHDNSINFVSTKHNRRIMLLHQSCSNTNKNKRKISVHKFCSNIKTKEKSSSTNLAPTKNTQNTKTASRLRMLYQQQYNNSSSNAKYINHTIRMTIIWQATITTCYIRLR